MSPSPRTAWLLVPLLAVAVWLVVRNNGEATEPHGMSATPVVTGRGVPVPSGGAGTPDERARPGSGSRHPLPAVADNASAPGVVPGEISNDPAGTRPPSTTGATARPVEPTRTGSPPPARPDDDAPAGKLTDRTGWGDASVAKQLNKEFMPLASECIDQARARKPRLAGLLAFTMVVAPTENGRVIVASLKLRPDNQIEDPELFECIRESSFALDGLAAPHDFDITMPIQPGGSG
jgi:hypothetical protein